MNLLVEQAYIEEADQSVFVANQLVVVIPADRQAKPQSVQDLLQEPYNYIAIGDPETVPAGNYTREALTTLKQWDSLKGKAVFGNNVRQVLSYVETGNADAGFVYQTDALTSDKVNIAFTLEPASHSPIHYYAGIVKNTRHDKEARDFYTFLMGKEAQEIFKKYGFASADQ